MKMNKGMCRLNIYESEYGYVSSEYL